MDVEAPRNALPVLGVVTFNYLRETGLIQTMKAARVAVIAPADSALHRIADYSCPVPSLDLSPHDINTVIDQLHRQLKVELSGLVSWRDPNVPAVVEVAAQRGWPTLCTTSALQYIRSKSAFRLWAAHHLPNTLHTSVDWRAIPSDISRPQFDRVLRELLTGGSVILKPDRGSCSYNITRVTPNTDTDIAWERFQAAHHFRGGDFIAERQISGVEAAVETIVSDHVSSIYLTQYLEPEEGWYYEVGHYATRQEPAWARAARTLSKELHDLLPIRHAITHLELIIPPSGPPAIVELNARVGGDLIPELHRLVSGVDIYRTLGRMATGQTLEGLVHRQQELYQAALIRFHRPVAGRVRTGRVAEYLRSPDDKFCLLQPLNSVLTGGDTNDDRCAYTLLAGDNLQELDLRSKALLFDCLSVERAGVIVTNL